MDSREAEAEEARGDSVNVSERSAAALITPPRNDKDFIGGILLLLVVVFLWTGSNFLTNYQLTQGYDKPFAVTYLNTASFSVYLLPFACLCAKKKGRSGTAREADQQKTSLWYKLGFVKDIASSGATSYAPLSTCPEGVSSIHSEYGRRRRSSDVGGTTLSFTGQRLPLTGRETAHLAGQFMVIWFLANYTLNVSLKLTSVASATTISSASGFFTLALGSLIGVERFTTAKLLAVTMSFTGVLLVTRADTKSGGEESSTYRDGLLGDMLALASSACYAIYVIMLKKKIGDENRISMPLFFGFVGMFSILLLWPLGILLHLFNLERIEMPSGQLMWAGVLVNVCITFVSDMAYLLAMLKSSPLVATIGLSLTIPLAIAGDTLLGRHKGGFQSYFGGCIVLLSFVAIGLADRASQVDDASMQ